MKYTCLGAGDLRVSRICLGTMTWGHQNTEAEAHEQIEYALDYGVNFLDTAEIYSVPPQKKTYGLTEKYIGTWFRKSGKRDRIILASKVSGPGVSYVPGSDGYTPAGMRTALENSLKRLKTDYIDLYQLHWPQRNTAIFGVHDYEPGWINSEDRMAETLQTLGRFVREGKIRAVGLSNETPWGVMNFLRLYEKNPSDLPRIASVQNVYSLVSRVADIHLSEVLLRENIGFLPYSPLAGGYLSGKYLNGQKPKNSRFTMPWGKERMSRYVNSHVESAVEAYAALAEEYGLSPVHLALAFVIGRRFTSSTIIGATTIPQLKECLEASAVKPNKEILKKITAIHLRHPNPAV